jgi:hypothetical protein
MRSRWLTVLIGMIFFLVGGATVAVISIIVVPPVAHLLSRRKPRANVRASYNGA